MGELERYRWCGDGVLMGKAQNSWQNTEEVLAYFGNKVRRARLKKKPSGTYLSYLSNPF
jgi:hypothetical protein